MDIAICKRTSESLVYFIFISCIHVYFMHILGIYLLFIFLYSDHLKFNVDGQIFNSTSYITRSSFYTPGHVLIDPV